MVPCSNHGRVILSEISEQGLETCETKSSAISDNSNIEIKSILYTGKKEDFELKSIYFLEKYRVEEYLKNNFSKNYSREMFNTLERIFVKFKANTLNDLKSLLEEGKVNQRAGRTSFRVLLNYFERQELVSEDMLAKLRNKIKLSIQSNSDTYIPSKENILDSLDRVKQIDSSYFILYKLILESGCRTSELLDMILKFDYKNIERENNIVIYRNFYLRKSKKSFYLFFREETFNEFLKIKEMITLEYFNTFREKIVRSKEIVSLKYLRKYQFTLMVKAGIDFEVANFIQGRSSNNIGFNHYLAKKEIALKEYRKIL